MNDARSQVRGRMERPHARTSGECHAGDYGRCSPRRQPSALRCRKTRGGTIAVRTFKSLNEQEILALAISLEEEDARIYEDFAEGLRADFPATAEILKEMRAEEDGHR